MTTDRLPRITAFYLSYLQQHDSRNFVNLVSRYYDEATLSRLTGSEKVETRRAAAMGLGLLGSYQSNESLGRLLKDTDRSVRLLAESSLKSVWTREGTGEQRHELYSIMRLINEFGFAEAVRCANNLLDIYPMLIETRNQRAIALFALKNFDESIADSEIVLDLNPYHFGAAVGTGHAYIQLRQIDKAIDCFQLALSINPNLENVRRHLERLTRV